MMFTNESGENYILIIFFWETVWSLSTKYYEMVFNSLCRSTGLHLRDITCKIDVLELIVILSIWRVNVFVYCGFGAGWWWRYDKHIILRLQSSSSIRLLSSRFAVIIELSIRYQSDEEVTKKSLR